MVSLVEARDAYTGGHLWRVSQFSGLLAAEVGLPAADVARVTLGGFLHDLGEIGVPDGVLNKPAARAQAEAAVMWTHPVVGARLLAGGLAVAAEPETPAEVELRWRPVYQLAYVTDGEDGRSPPAFMVAGGEGTGALTRPFLARGELRAWVPAGDALGLYGRVEEGSGRSGWSPAAPSTPARTCSWRRGAGLEHAFADDAVVRATLGLRLAGWALADVPTHGNLGTVFGLHPRWRAVDLDLEGTLAAIGTDAPVWGTQKDSSSLRAGIGLRVPVGERSVRVGGEVLHTKTEWFGGDVVAGEPALALEDLRVAGEVGFGI